MNTPKWAKLAALAVVGFPVMLAVQALPAVGQSSPPVAGIRLGSGAKIADRGAVVFSHVLIACPAGDSTVVQVQLTERSGGGIAQGFGFANPTCNGNIQTITIPVPAANKPFVHGTAFGQASIDVFDPSGGFNSNSDSRNVKLR
jgi:hypothetical protein